MTKKQKKMLVRILITAVMLIALKFIPITGIPQLLAYVAAYLVIGYDILRKAGKGILNGRAFDENFLMTLATLGAFFLAIWTKSGDYVEGIAVMLFYQIGELFQSYAVGRSRKNISALMDIRPDYANIEVDGKLEKVDPDEVSVGSIIVVQPGEKVPLDGVIIDGTSTLNTSALTGESLPRDAKTGDEIISGCINMTGVLKVRTTKAFGESTVSKILELMENSSSHKSRSESFISRFAKVYTPAVCYSALALAILPPLVLTVSGAENCIWTSSNTAAATVSDDGTVTAVGAGSATVSVTTADGSATATCSVTVTAKQDLRMAYDYGTTYFEKLDIWTIGSEDFDTTLKVGESFRMCMLSGGEKISAEIQWSTSNGSVATISDGNLLTGVASGETVLTAVVDGQTFTAIIRVK